MLPRNTIAWSARTRPRISGLARICTMAVEDVMNTTLAKPTNNAAGNDAARTGDAANANKLTPNNADPTATERIETLVRRAVASAPVQAPMLTTEYNSVKVVSDPCIVILANNGSTTEKLNANVPTIAIITNGVQRSGTDRTYRKPSRT